MRSRFPNRGNQKFRDVGLRDRTNANPNHRDGDLGGRDIGRDILKLFRQRLGGPVALAGKRIDLGLASADNPVFGRDKENATEDQ